MQGFVKKNCQFHIQQQIIVNNLVTICMLPKFALKYIIYLLMIKLPKSKSMKYNSSAFNILK